uniref:Apyrase n=1 Tax=Strongyloides papillosus TaxID=174720 RepID=A0A0N5B3C2_STREA
MYFFFNVIFYLISIYIQFIYGGAIIKSIYHNQQSIEMKVKGFIGNEVPDNEDIQILKPYNDTLPYTVVEKNGQIHVPFIIISDQDRDAKIHDKNHKTVYASTVEMGVLTVNKDFSSANVRLSIKTQDLITKLNYDSRGAEFSDLKWFNGHLITVDDKTGVIYKIEGKKLVVQGIMNDGLDSDKLYKGEWLTVKDKKMYVGGYGKEFTNGNGTQVTNVDPFFIKVFDRNMGYETLNWTNNFINVRKSIGITFPAYIVNEAVQWSEVNKKWFFLPRKVSFNPYTDADAEIAGSNILITADENFEIFGKVTVGEKVPDQGFSAFQFVPKTNEKVIIALKSKETEKEGVSSFIMVFHINGTVLYGPRKIPGKYKMEGIEFYNWRTEFNVCQKR